jgi:hypothetical protein
MSDSEFHAARLESRCLCAGLVSYLIFWSKSPVFLLLLFCSFSRCAPPGFVLPFEYFSSRCLVRCFTRRQCSSPCVCRSWSSFHFELLLATCSFGLCVRFPAWFLFLSSFILLLLNPRSCSGFIGDLSPARIARAVLVACDFSRPASLLSDFLGPCTQRFSLAWRAPGLILFYRRICFPEQSFSALITSCALWFSIQILSWLRPGILCHVARSVISTAQVPVSIESICSICWPARQNFVSSLYGPRRRRFLLISFGRSPLSLSLRAHLGLSSSTLLLGFALCCSEKVMCLSWVDCDCRRSSISSYLLMCGLLQVKSDCIFELLN